MEVSGSCICCQIKCGIYESSPQKVCEKIQAASPGSGCKTCTVIVSRIIISQNIPLTTFNYSFVLVWVIRCDFWKRTICHVMIWQGYDTCLFLLLKNCFIWLSTQFSEADNQPYRLKFTDTEDNAVLCSAYLYNYLIGFSANFKLIFIAIFIAHNSPGIILVA